MNKSRKTSNLYNIVTYDDSGNVVLPASLTLGTSPASNDNSSKVATTSWIASYISSLSLATSSSVTTAISNLVAAAPTTLDTLNELATALGNDPNFATTIATSIGTKVSQARTITINGTAYDLSADRSWTIAAGVTSFNTRTGAITLSSSDVTTALGYTPMPTITFVSPLYVASGGDVNIRQATATIDGYLSATDWATFNNKLSAATAASTYLPLSGGTLTGALIGTGATFSNAVNITGANLGHAANKTVLSQEGSSNGAFWQSYGANTTTVGKFTLRQYSSDASVSIIALSIETSGAATFSGSLTTNGTFNFAATGNVSFTSNDANNYARFTGNSASAQIGLFRASDGGMYIGGSANGFRVFDSSFNTRLLLAPGGQLQLNTYTSATSYTGTAAGYLAFDSSGNIITVAGVTGTDNTKLPLAGGTMTGALVVAAGDRGFEVNASGGISLYSNEINAGALGGTGTIYMGWRRTTQVNVGVPMVLSSSISATAASLSGLLSFSATIGNKIDFYYSGEDRYGIQVQSSELRIHSGAQGAASGGITFGKSTSGTFTEAIRIRNDGNVLLANAGTLILGIDDTMDRTVVGGASRTRLQLAPPSHTGAEWTFVTYDDSANAYIRIGYGNGSASFQMRHDGYTTIAGNVVIHSANYSSYALPLSGGTLAGPVTLNDSSYFRGSPTYGFRFNNNADTLNLMSVRATGDMYVRGQVYVGGDGFSSGTQLVYNSGSWGISVTGSAGSTTYLSALGDYVFDATTNGRSFNRGIQTSFVSASQSYPSYGSVVRIRTYTGTEDGGTAELYFPYNSTYGGSSMRYRMGQYANAGWTNWKTVIDSDNIGSQSVSSATTVTHYSGRTDGTAYNVVWAAGNPSHMYSCDAVKITSSDGTLTATNLTATSNVRGNDVYTTGGWFRNHTNNAGIYWSNTSWHIYPANSSDMNWRSGGTTTAVRMVTSDDVARGYFYANNSNEIGILANDGNWGLRVTSGKTTYLHGHLYVNYGGASSSIYMYDSDEGTREIHCNSNRIGFLNQSSSWGAWCDDGGNWLTSGGVYGAIFYDYDNGGYYLDPNSMSNLYAIQMPHLGNGTSNLVVNNGGSENWGAIRIEGGSGNLRIGKSDAGRSWSGRVSLAMHVGASESFRVHSDGWDSLFEVWGSSGYARLKGSLEVGSDVYLGAKGNWMTTLLDAKQNTLTYPMYYAGFTLDADTMPTNSTGFTYSVNAPTTGSIVKFSTGGGYDLQLNSDYYWGSNLYFRQRNGDVGAWRSWRRLLNVDSDPYAANMNQYVRTTDSPSFSEVTAGYHRSYYLTNRYDVSVDHTYGIYFQNYVDYSYAIFRESGAWSHPYPDLRIAFHTGIKIGAYYGYNGTRFYNNSDMATITASVNDGDNNFRGYYDIIAYASDKRLKHNVKPIENAISKVMSLTGMTYEWNSIASKHGWEPSKEREAGVFAQDVQAVLPEAVRPAPFDHAHDEKGNSYSKSGENFLTVKYEKIVPLLIEGIKEQQAQIEAQGAQITELMEIIKTLKGL